MDFDFKIVRIVQSQEVGLQVYNSLDGRWTQLDLAWHVYNDINNKVVLLDIPIVPLKICFGVSTVCVGKNILASERHWIRCC